MTLKVKLHGSRNDNHSRVNCAFSMRETHKSYSTWTRVKMTSKAASTPTSQSQQNAGLSSSGAIGGGGAAARADAKDRHVKERSKDRDDDLPDSGFFNRFDTNNDLSNAA
jgi:hypothetical protein